MALYLDIETVSCQLLQLDAMMDVELKLEKLGNLFQFFCCMLRKLLRSIVLCHMKFVWYRLFHNSAWVAFYVWETKLADFKTEWT